MLEAPQLRCERRCLSCGTPPSAIHYPHAVPICCHRPNRWSRGLQNGESCNIFLTLTLISGPGRLREELAPGPEPPTPLCCSRKSRRDRSCVSSVFTTARSEEPTGGLRPVTKGKSKYFFPLPMPRGAGAVARPVSGGAESGRLKAARTCHPPSPGGVRGCCPGGRGKQQAAALVLSPTPSIFREPRSPRKWSHPHDEALRVVLDPAPCSCRPDAAPQALLQQPLPREWASASGGDVDEHICPARSRATCHKNTKAREIP